MDELRLARIEKKLDLIIEHTARIDNTLAVQAQQLTEHMRRTKLAEQAIQLIQNSHMKYAIGIIAALSAIIVQLYFKH